MIKNSHSQTGSTHAVIIIILVLALLGTLGFVFWQNFTSNDEANNTSTTIETERAPMKNTNTYRNESIGIEFEYPKEWLKVECDNTYIENPSDTVYFGTTDEGLAIVDGKDTQLCGGGSDFPPQMTFAIRTKDENGPSPTNPTKVSIDGRAAKKSVGVTGPDSIMPGLESTGYFVELDDNKYVIFSYSRFPEMVEGERDNSQASRDLFTKMIEEDLKFI
jgi:archaellum component FlaF (FlaF/FlaG flagellin family)